MVNGKMNQSKDMASRLDALESGLAALRKKRIVAGNGIRVTEFDSVLLIEAEEPDVSETAEPEDARIIAAGEGVRVTDEGGVIRIGLEDEAIPVRQPPRSAEKYVPPAYPFEVAATGARTVTMYGLNEEDGRYFVNCVFRGVGSGPIVVPETNFTVTENCYLLLKIVPTGSGINFSLTAQTELAAVIPIPTDDLFVVPLAYIHCEPDSLTVQQMHFGNVFIYDRIV